MTIEEGSGDALTGSSGLAAGGGGAGPGAEARSGSGGAGGGGGDGPRDGAGDDFPLRNVRPDALDKRGRLILDVLWAVRDFKIYKTRYGISPHFSDDPEVETLQRQRYVALGSELAYINYLVDLLRPRRSRLHWLPWKRPGRPVTGHAGKGDAGAGTALRAEAEREVARLEDPARVHFERETARAIAQALIGNPEQGRASLAALTAQLEKRLLNRGRVAYLAVCVACAMAISAIAGYFLTEDIGINGPELALAAIMGSVGALLSTAAGLPALRLDPSAVWRMNVTYGVQRMLVGVLGAMVLYLALRAGFVHQILPGAEGVPADEHMDAYHLAFLSVLAGFSERLVPNLLERTADGAGETATPPNGAGAGDGGPQQGDARPEKANGSAAAPGGDTAKGKAG